MAFSFSAPSFRRWHSFFAQLAVFVCLAASAGIPLQSKDVTLIAIELYDGPNGPAYVHITDILINGKTELRNCASMPKIDKSGYGKLPKVFLGPGAELEYGRDGVLILTKDGIVSCVVPTGLKFDKNSPVTPAELASRVVLQAKILSSGADANQAAPPLKIGVKIVFVTAPDVELAEFLRADRANTIPLWQDYLGKYPSSKHTAQAKESLTTLLVKDGNKNLDAYRNSLSSATRDYAALKNARMRSAKALTVLATFDAAKRLEEESKGEVDKIISEGLQELQEYGKSLKGHTSRYSHLAAAGKLADALIEIDPHYAPALPFETEAKNAAQALESKLQSGESLIGTKRFDEGYAAISPYISLVGEVPRIAAIAKATYDFHYQRAQELAAGTQDWEGAVNEYQKAADISATEQVVAALNNAKTELQAARDKHAADLAVQQSHALETSGQIVPAYETLFNLPERQKVLVAAELDRLSPAYVQAASDLAKELQQAHDPIKGLRDEQEMERAYGYLKQANTLTNDPQLKDRQQDLADKISEYCLQQAKRYMDKPLGSGAGLGWWFLEKALPYNASNLEAVRDERTRSTPAYQMRAKLSIGVQFRDQTSRRDSAGFAEQLADALATGLETSGLPVTVVRPNDHPAVEPNFQLIGDVIEHVHATVPTSTPKESKYLVGEQQMPNADWNKANRDYESTKLDLQRAEGALQGARSRGKKKEIKDANDKVTEAQKKVEDAHTKLDAIPQSKAVDIIKPYTYTEKQIDLQASVRLQFRINDATGSQVETAESINKGDTKKFTKLENVKPEDTTGVKEQGTIPDDMQLVLEVENSARDALILAVKESVKKFPDKIFDQANKHADSGDEDAAAEFFILYLNSTPSEPNAKRKQAEQYLLEKFNIRRSLGSETSARGN